MLIRKHTKRIMCQIACVLSQKTKVLSENVASHTKTERYTSFLCFNNYETEYKGNKCVLEYPNNHCRCYKGQVMFLHLTGMLLLFHLMQTCNKTKENFVRDLPGPLQWNHHILMMIENSMRKDTFERSKGQKKDAQGKY